MRIYALHALVVLAMAWLLVGCNHNTPFFEDKVSFEHHNWPLERKLHYSIETQPKYTYNLVGIIATNAAYRAPFLKLDVLCNFPSGKLLYRSLDFNRKKGRRQATTYDTIMLRPGLSVQQAGVLEVELSIQSQYLNNEGIESMQFMVLRQ